MIVSKTNDALEAGLQHGSEWRRINTKSKSGNLERKWKFCLHPVTWKLCQLSCKDGRSELYNTTVSLLQKHDNKRNAQLVSGKWPGLLSHVSFAFFVLHHLIGLSATSGPTQFMLAVKIPCEAVRQTAMMSLSSLGYQKAYGLASDKRKEAIQNDTKYSGTSIYWNDWGKVSSIRAKCPFDFFFFVA